MRHAYLLLGVLAGSLGVASAPGLGQMWRPEPPRAAPGCTVFEHSEYGGARREVRAGESIRSVGSGWNDRISSVECAPQCELMAAEHVDFAGARRVFGSTRFVGPDWNDRISAMQVSCQRAGWGSWGGREERGPACTVYWDANFAGRQERFGDGMDLPFIGPSWNDQVSAVSCRPGCRLTAYEHANYAGQSREFTSETAYVGPGWNDRISALRVRCS